MSFFDCSNDGIFCNSAGDGVRGLGPGTGRDVDLEGGRPVTGFTVGYTGRASEVMFGARFVDVGRLGRRNSLMRVVAATTVGEALAVFGDVFVGEVVSSAVNVPDGIAFRFTGGAFDGFCICTFASLGKAMRLIAKDFAT